MGPSPKPRATNQNRYAADPHQEGELPAERKLLRAQEENFRESHEGRDGRHHDRSNPEGTRCSAQKRRP
jgi:hypothetical protein